MARSLRRSISLACLLALSGCVTTEFTAGGVTVKRTDARFWSETDITAKMSKDGDLEVTSSGRPGEVEGAIGALLDLLRARAP